MKKYKLLSIFLAGLSFFSFALPTNTNAIKITGTPYDKEIMTTHIADPSTVNSYKNIVAGEVWTDKTVSDKENGNMGITLSAITKDNILTSSEEVGYDVSLILDVTGSMQGSVNGKAKYIAMVNTVNEAIKKLMNTNSKNRVSVTIYSTTSKVIMPLARYKTTGQYLEYAAAGTNGYDVPTIFVSSKTKATTSVDVNYDPVKVSGATYTQLGIKVGANVLANSTDTTNFPAIILLTDGYPTVWSQNYTNPTTSNHTGKHFGSVTGSVMGYHMILSANHFKQKVKNAYDKKVRFYTIGILKSTTFGKAVLNPNAINIEALANGDHLAKRLKQALEKEEDFTRFYGYASDQDYFQYEGGVTEGIYNYNTKILTFKMDEVKPTYMDGNGGWISGIHFRFEVERDPDITSDLHRLYTATITYKTADGVSHTEKIGTGSEESNQFVKREPYRGEEITVNGEKKTIEQLTVRRKEGNTETFYDVTVKIELNTKYDAKFIEYQVPKNLYSNIDYSNLSWIGELDQDDLTNVFNKIVDSLEIPENALTAGTYVTFKDTIGDNFKLVSNVVVTLNGTDYTFKKDGNSYKTEEASVLYNKNNKQITTDNVTITLNDKVLTVKIPAEIVPSIDTGAKPIRIKYNVELESIINGTFYTNSSAQATFKPKASNLYYKSFSTKTTNKTSNDTGKLAYVKKSSINSDTRLVTDLLGNNGKIVLALNNLTITKIWKDNGNKYSTRPSSVNIVILQNGETYKTVTLSSDNVMEDYPNRWRITDVIVPKYDSSGNAYTYTVKELTITLDNGDTYVPSISGTTLTNTLTGTTSYSGTKVWKDNSNALNLRPTNYTVKLLRNGTELKSASFSNSKGWSFTGLAIYDANGKKYTYSIQEETITLNNGDTYVPSINGTTLTNTLTGITSLSGTKIWKDNSNALNLRPANYTVKLYRNGNYQKDASFSNSKGWSFTGLAKYDANGKIYTYTIQEDEIILSNGDRYVPSLNGNILTNTLTGTTSLSGTKVWEDNNNAYNTRPSTYTVKLYRNGAYQKDATFANSKGWSFSGLVKYDVNGKLYTYTIQEDSIILSNGDKYVPSINGTILTNTLIGDLGLTVTKIWEDRENKYNTRPTTLDITIFQNGVAYKTITLSSSNVLSSDSNKWQMTDIAAPKYDANNNPYVYTIQEDTQNRNIMYYYIEPVYDQNTLTVTNTAVFIPMHSNNTPRYKYKIIINKEIINNSGEIVIDNDFNKIDLNSGNIFKFPIVLKQLNTELTTGETGMIESYSGYSGKIFNGVVTNENEIVFSAIEAGKYEVLEGAVEYFDFIGMEKISSSSGASFSYENGKYYITISGISKSSEEIEIKVINKIDDERLYDDTEDRNNIFDIGNN